MEHYNKKRKKLKIVERKTRKNGIKIVDRVEWQKRKKKLKYVGQL